MRITSLEIKQHEFEKSFRGYNVDEVNQFLDKLSQEWEKMLNETKMLKMQLDISEKEASKLKEIEMTLIKTLKTAEDTSSKITQTANAEAAKKVEEANATAQKTIEEANHIAQKTINDAKEKATEIVTEAEFNSKKLKDEAERLSTQLKSDAENHANQVVAEAQTKAKEIQKASEQEIAELDAKYAALDQRRNQLLGQLKTLNEQLGQLIGNPDEIVAVPLTSVAAPTTTPVVAPVKEEPKVTPSFFEETKVTPVVETPQVQEEEEEEDFSNGISLPSAVNKINLEHTEEEEKDLEIIEGIGPKIKEVLFNAGIKDFRTLATTPEYRLRDILTAAGSHFNAHDPSTWNEQALLAANGHWERLEELKAQLIAGRAPKPAVQEETTSVDGTNTEEMLDKVNKVKAAIRKAMIEKSSDNSNKDESSSSSGSFFDNI